MQINVAAIIERSVVNGPGERFVLWVQGCSLHCPGCWNPGMWSREAKVLMSVEQVLARIKRVEGIDGVTLTGGEPFEQSEALVILARAVRERGLTVMAFTGYEVDELAEESQQDLASLCDILVTGRYQEQLAEEGLLWRGSSNQTVRGAVPGDLKPRERMVCEVHLDGHGRSHVTGFPPKWLFGDEGQIDTE